MNANQVNMFLRSRFCINSIYSRMRVNLYYLLGVAEMEFWGKQSRVAFVIYVIKVRNAENIFERAKICQAPAAAK